MSTFGNESTGSTPTDNPGGNVVWCKATSTPASDGTLNSVSAYCNILAGTPFLGVALYTDSAGVPGTLIAQEDTTMGAAGASFGWVTTNLAASITAGTQYWFAVRVPGGPTNDINVHYDGNGGATELRYIAGSDFPANATGSNPAADERWSVYGTYTPSGGGGSDPINAAFAEDRLRQTLRPRPFAPGIPR